MEIRFQYFDGCPNWQVTHERLEEAFRDRDDVAVVMERVETSEEAAAVGFRGSPTILIDGIDPFGGPDDPIAGTLSCRVYRTPDGSPTAAQLRAALAP